MKEDPITIAARRIACLASCGRGITVEEAEKYIRDAFMYPTPDNPFAGVEYVEAFDPTLSTWRRATIERWAPYRGRPGWYIRWADRKIESWESSGGWVFLVRAEDTHIQPCKP